MDQNDGVSSSNIYLVSLTGDSMDTPNHSHHSTDTETSDVEEHLLPTFHHQKKLHASTQNLYLPFRLIRRTGILFLCFLRELSPSFLRLYQSDQPLLTSQLPPRDPSATRATRTIKYLDGLRGVACLIVFNFHFLYPYTVTIIRGWGLPAGEGHYRFFHRLPFICLLYRGRAMVVLFFGISGYVLSYRYLSLLRIHAWEASQKSLASMTLRRWARLFLPSTASMFMVMLAAYAGAFEAGRIFQESEWKTGSWEQHPPKHSTFRAQLHDFASMFWDWSGVWTWNWYFSNYDPHTWTIPLEFRSSVVLFASLAARTRLRLFWGWLYTLVVAIYCFSWGHWDVGIFLGGSLVADIHLFSATKSESSSYIAGNQVKKGKGRIFTILVWIVFLFGLFILSFPDEGADITPGFAMLASLTPSIYGQKFTFWQSLACILILWCLGVQKSQRKVFESRISEYLGKISYALYLTHGPLLHSAGFALQPHIWRTVGHNRLSEWIFGLLIGWLIMLSLAIVVADLFYRWVDVVLVTFTKRIENLVSVS